jgi:cyclopropane-fatty-acyl-phospholipid synthase
MEEFLVMLAEKRLLPDFLIRYGIRRRNKNDLKHKNSGNLELLTEKKMQFYKECLTNKVALSTDEANQQHYELPTEFFQYVLGDNLKYSCSIFTSTATKLSEAEHATLELYSQRANIQDGQKILELGCGWGSLSLYLAQKYPGSQVTAVSNSSSQKQFIDSRARELGLKNLNVITYDINELELTEKFDRIVSIEMFEHIANHYELFHRISKWLKPDGLLFVHIFCHKQLASAYGKDTWMAKYFFTDGMMPSVDQFLHLQDHLKIEYRWMHSGSHYEKTANAWLMNMDADKDNILAIMKETYGGEYRTWFQRWRMFFMACAELFGYRKGNEWFVSHYLFSNRRQG